MNKAQLLTNLNQGTNR